MTALFSFLLLCGVAFGAELSARQSSTCSNGTTTTPVGLQFTKYCSNNILGYDVNSVSGTSLDDCVNKCSLSQSPAGSGPCQAVSFDIPESTCWFKDGNATASLLIYQEGIETAIADADQYLPLDTTCPTSNLTVRDATNGMPFQVNCGTDSWSNDFDDTAEGTYYTPFHANTLQECMDWCALGHPLCYAVVFNPDLQRGYRNCYPKNSNISGQLISSVWVMHTALAQLTVNDTCDNGIYITSDGKSFGRTCGQTMDGTNIDQRYMPDFESCIDHCSSYNQNNETCKVAVYQPSAAYQYENCYLKAPGQYSTYSQSDFDMAILASSVDVAGGSSTSTLSPGSTGSANSDTNPQEKGDRGDSSKAWIAGAVLGPLAAILLIVGAIFMLRRRKYHSVDESYQTNDKVPPELVRSTPPYSDDTLCEADGSVARSELDARKSARYEMP